MNLHQAYLGLGSNLGDKFSNIQKAYVLIEQKVGEIEKKSAFYVTEPWGFESEDLFVNTVIEIKTQLTPMELLDELKIIEIQLGRKTKSLNGYASRIIDIDILSYNQKVITELFLTIPHPYIEKRNFVYVPFLEICPDWQNPKTGQFLKTINADGNIKKVEKKNSEKY